MLSGEPAVKFLTVFSPDRNSSALRENLHAIDLYKNKKPSQGILSCVEEFKLVKSYE
jgi:hypothetical protein